MGKVTNTTPQRVYKDENGKMVVIGARDPIKPDNTTVSEPETDTSSETDTYSSDKAIQKFYDMMNTAINSFTANPLETDWGKQMLEAYGIKADDSATGVKASAAAENSGNVDSYAVANAERQRIAKLGQGIEAINGMNAERNNNLINLLNNIGVNTQTLLGLETPTTVVNKIPTAAELAEYMQGYYNQASKSGQYESDQAALNAVADMMRSSDEFGYIPYYLFWEAMKNVKDKNEII